MCLGRYYSLNSTWGCIQKPTLHSEPWLERFKIRQNGIYAMLFNPNPDVIIEKGESFCGILCKNKRLFFVTLLIILPAFIVLSIMFFK